jgi:hypothetical protein
MRLHTGEMDVVCALVRRNAIESGLSSMSALGPVEARAIRRYVQVMQSTVAVVSRSSTGISWPIRGGRSLCGRKT